MHYLKYERICSIETENKQLTFGARRLIAEIASALIFVFARK